MASFVQKKANKQWVWIAMDAKTRQIIAFHVGDRSHTSAEQLWAKIPQAYRQHATFYTDQYVVYAKVIPVAQHQAISKLARKTNHIERFNNTCASVCHGWSATRYPFPRSSPTISGPSSSSSVTTI